MHGILPLDKPRGLTSHDAVAIVRRLAGQRSVGHAGTLDPLATGVLVLCLGDATRLSDHLMATRKWYLARVLFGYGTETDDIDGSQVRTAPYAPDGVAMHTALSALVGSFVQLPPAFSAIKQAGVRAYTKARRNQIPELPPRPVTVGALALLGIGEREFLFRNHSPVRVKGSYGDLLLECGSGTYVRALARDLGEALGTLACIAGLRRLASGRFTVRDTISLADLQRDPRSGWAHSLRPADAAVVDLPAVVLGSSARDRVLSGAQVEVPVIRDVDAVRIYSAAGHLVAVGQAVSLGETTECAPSLRLQPRRVFAGGEAG
jgi:tRNA pseudouridine55 synthase